MKHQKNKLIVYLLSLKIMNKKDILNNKNKAKLKIQKKKLIILIIKLNKAHKKTKLLLKVIIIIIINKILKIAFKV